MVMTAPLLRVEKLEKSYLSGPERLTIFANLDLTVERGG
jgi:hypothetical protein